MTRQLFLAFTLGLLTCLPVQAQTTASDDAAIKDVVRRYADAREARDPEAVAALFTEDALQLVSSGEWRRGRDVLVKGTMASSARNTGTRTIVVETLRMLAPDVANADARYEISGAETRKMWSTFVLVRQQGQWRISAIRNMLPAPPAAASAPAAGASEQEAILAVVDRFMLAVTTSDAALFAEIRIPDTMNIVERPADGGGTRLVKRPFAPGEVKGNYRERYWDPVVHVRGSIAVVWTPYEFWRDGTSSHCGVDVFELAKEDGRWRIGNMMWTVEPDACSALRPADTSRIRPRP
jgi:uncharacterized protein (TIGR02246 family)